MQSLRFPHKLWKMANECQTDAVRWSSSGKSIILNYKQLQEQYLPSSAGLFKTNNVTSFIRQLNLYGFKKVAHSENRSLHKGSDIHEFKNSNFVQGRADLLKWVTRKSEFLPLKKRRQVKKSSVSTLYNCKTMCRNRIKSDRRANRGNPNFCNSFSLPKRNPLEDVGNMIFETMSRRGLSSAGEVAIFQPPQNKNLPMNSEATVVYQAHAHPLYIAQHDWRAAPELRDCGTSGHDDDSVILSDVLLSQSSCFLETPLVMANNNPCNSLCAIFCRPVAPTEFVKKIFPNSRGEQTIYIY